MYPALYVADLHLTSRPLDEYRWQLFDWLKVQVAQREIKTLVILGDLTDAKDNHPSQLVNRLTDALNNLHTKTNVKIHILKGNHDYLDAGSPFFEFFKHIPGIVYHITPTEWSDEETSHDCLFLPHTKCWRTDWQQFNFKAYNRIFLHQAIEGAESESGKRVEGVPQSLFAQQKLSAKVYAGDIHVPQTLGRATYVGAPYPVRFGDNFTPRVILDTGAEQKSIQRVTIKKVALTIQKVTDLREKQLGLSEGDMIKVVYKLPRQELVNWSTHQQEVKVEADRLKLRLCSCRLEVQAERVRIQSMDESTRSSVTVPKATLQAFMRDHGINEELLGPGVQVLEGVLKHDER